MGVQERVRVMFSSFFSNLKIFKTRAFKNFETLFNLSPVLFNTSGGYTREKYVIFEPALSIY